MSMAIKDSLVNEILKREGNSQNSLSLYKRLRILNNTDDQTHIDLEKINKKTEYKVDTNRTQTEHKPDTKPNTKWTQTEYNVASFKKTEHKVDTQPNTILNTKWTQTEHKPNTKYPFSSLIGLQRTILFFLFQHCKTTRNRVTQELSLIHIAESLKIPVGSVKTTFSRLEKKEFIKRKEFKNGRGGWSRYELPDNVYTQLLYLETEHKPNTNWTQTGHKVDTKLNTELNTTVPSSSSDLIKTTTTHEPNFEKNLNNFEDWKKVDLLPLTEIGFSQDHLFQIAKKNLIPPEVVQESIHAFAFDLTKNDKAKLLKKTPLDFFMGILRSGPYLPPTNYKSPKEMALEAFIEKQNNIKKLEEEAMNIAFQNWVSKLTSDEKNHIIPEETKKLGYPALINQAMRTHFKENVWPSMAEKMRLQKIN